MALEIVSDPISVTKVMRTRATQIYITNPYNGNPDINFISEKLLLIDDQPTASLPAPAVDRKFNDVATQTVTISDPVTGQLVTVSAAGLAVVFAQFYCNWFEEDEALRQSRLAADAAIEAARLAASRAAIELSPPPAN